jgi:hypothetical protein
MLAKRALAKIENSVAIIQPLAGKLTVVKKGGLSEQQREFVRTNKVELLDQLIDEHSILDFLQPCELIPGDRPFVLGLIPSDVTRVDVLTDYRKQWIAGMETEPVDHKKQNTGRFRANSWLRKIDKTGI